jgi:hypothetical protein
VRCEALDEQSENKTDYRSADHQSQREGGLTPDKW